MYVNVVLTVLKLIFGYFAGSISLIADGYHSLSDLATDVAVLVGSKFSVKPADKNHPFGHGKFETFAALFVAIAVIIVGIGIIHETVDNILSSGKQLNSRMSWVAVIAIISLVSKEWLYKATMKIARITRSSAVEANAWHHRSDALSSLVVLFGAVVSLLGWHWGDLVAGMLVGLMIIIVGGKLGFDSIADLTDVSAGKEIIEDISKVLDNSAGIHDWHRLRVRRIGRELIMDLHVTIDGDLSVREGHKIIDKVEKQIYNTLSWPVQITIHLDPYPLTTADEG